MSTIDRADWHFGNNFPKNIPDENGGTHIGMFLNWIIDTGLIGEIHLKDSEKGIYKVRKRQITGRDFLFDYCDGKFWNEDLNILAIQFTEDYYSSDKYFDDYADALAKSTETIYHVDNNWDNYETIKKILDKRYHKWKVKRNKKSWQFWK